MKRLVINSFAAIILSFIAVSCTELPHNQTPVDKDSPLSLNNIQIESLPGGAKITYEVSNETDISYVKAEYTYKGVKNIVRSSIYNNFLMIEGLGSVEPVEVTLYVVDHSENSSEGITKTFTPDTPPLDTVFESVEISALYGGVAVKFDNATATEIGVTLFYEDKNGILQEGQTHFSNDKLGEISFRPFDPVENRFAVRLMDKWGNYSDLKETHVAPLFETEFSKKKFREVGLPGDNTSNLYNYTLANTWDDDDWSLWTTDDGAGYSFPEYFTIDVGILAKLSRIRVRTRTLLLYCNNAPRTFEVWGAATYKTDKDAGYWTGDEWKTDGDWEMLGDFEIKRPSGITEEVCNPDGIDKEEGEKGFFFNIPVDKKPLQYLRFIIKTTWTEGGTAIHMAEFGFYGDDGSNL